jgi:hypothetical protein
MRGRGGGKDDEKDGEGDGMEGTNCIYLEQNLQNFFMMYMFPVFFLAMMMLYFVTMARGLVKEKELKLKEGMRMMGLRELPYWASWFSYYSIPPLPSPS